MTAKKRDQRHYDLVQQHLPGLILNTVLGVIQELGDPYVARPGLGGMAAYPSGAMAAVCVMLKAERTTYRKIVDPSGTTAPWRPRWAWPRSHPITRQRAPTG